jgi:hypothetical protein
LDFYLLQPRQRRTLQRFDKNFFIHKFRAAFLFVSVDESDKIQLRVGGSAFVGTLFALKAQNMSAQGNALG